MSEKDLSQRMQRDVVLSEGKEIGGFWFNEDLTHKFFNVMNTAINLGMGGFRWKNTKGQVVDITIDQAKKMAGVMLNELASVYLD